MRQQRARQLRWITWWVACFILLAPVHACPSSDSLLTSQGLKILEEIQEAISALAEKVTPTVVNISPVRKLGHAEGFSRQRNRGPGSPGSGSGVIIHEDGFIVTNNHVIGNATEAEVRFSDKTTLIAEIVGRDPDTDLALLKVSARRKLPSARFGDSSKVKVGQWVLAVGNPFGLDRTVTLGVVSGIGRENMNLSRYENFIQTDASINPGNSGGPLFNLRGEVIGINTAIINFAQGIGFAIPSNMVNRIVSQLKTKGRVVRGWLGVGIQPLTAELAEKFGVENGKGVLVNEVFPNDPAAQAGIQPGDVIIGVGGEPVESPNQLSRVVASIGPGEPTKIELIRDGVLHTLTVTLGIKKDEPVMASLPPPQKALDLGIDVMPITETLAKKYQLDERKGVLVVKVKRGSMAYAEGLREGDIIKEVNRVEVPTIERFSEALEAIEPGETVLLRIIRNARSFYVVLRPQG
ncbi:MAG: Do family serine endopeptidase [Nitrospirae bacterium]|nr:MAG: Do family serine endopeptidase [Nitrospirota bacterium]